MDAPENVPGRMRLAVRAAMKARDASAVRALRTALAAIENAEAVEALATAPRGAGTIAGAVQGLGATEVPRRELTAADVLAVVRTEVADRERAANDYDRLGQRDEAIRLRTEADVLRAYLLPD